MSNLAETILRDVPRYNVDETTMGVRAFAAADGIWLDRDEVLAALTAAMDGVDERVGEIVSELREVAAVFTKDTVFTDAADLITALLTQNAALRANTVQALDEADREYSRKTNDLVERHAEQLAALRAEVRKSAMDAVSAGCQAQEAYEAQKAAEARAERLEAALRLLHDNVVLAFPALANLGPVANARAALSATDYTLAPHLQKIVDGAKTAPQWDMQADRLAPTDAPHVNETPKSEHDGADVLTDAAQAREAALMEAHKAILAMDTKKDEDLTYNLAVLRAAEKVRRLISEART